MLYRGMGAGEVGGGVGGVGGVSGVAGVGGDGGGCGDGVQQDDANYNALL